jgi:hypothetical protein
LRVTGTRGGRAARTFSTEHLLDGAAEVDVDDVVALGHESPGRRGKVVGIGSHQLASDGMFVIGHRQSCEIAAVGADAGDELIEQHLAQRIRRPVPPGDQPHGAVAVAGERRLHDRRVEVDTAERQRPGRDARGGHVSTGH